MQPDQMAPTWGPPVSCRPQMDLMLAPWITYVAAAANTESRMFISDIKKLLGGGGGGRQFRRGLWAPNLLLIYIIIAETHGTS